MQILHRFVGTIQQYEERILDPDHDRPEQCPQCQARQSFRAHGFYRRTLGDVVFQGTIRVRRFLCCSCRRTLSLLPQLALPYLRFSVPVICLFLFARFLERKTLEEAARAAAQPGMPYQRGQFWIRRFRRQAEELCASLVARIAAPPAVDFLSRALRMLEGIGPVRAHRFLLGDLRVHLLGWPPFLSPAGLRLIPSPGLAFS